MKILAVDSSAVAASAALTQDGKILGEFYSNTGLTHSQTLMPMIAGLLHSTRTPLAGVDLFAVSAGPGSFTGIRIGVASVKGLAMPGGRPCIGVSTLEAIAWNLAHLDGTVCAVMDARCHQVYNAVFRAAGGGLKRLCPDRAISIADLAEECKSYAGPLFLVGDGARLCYNSAGFQKLRPSLPPEILLYQRASGVAKAAEAAYTPGYTAGAAELMPVYLRPAQAQRALKNKKTEGKEYDCFRRRPRRIQTEGSHQKISGSQPSGVQGFRDV
ncbi:MAG TPA: tRNA (adenosine(37)-N6)-threonylcarbamoyltransferase complex dimerization subunit type 1 TsaB [Ruminococcaceae bacterium]|jgi:tRNA threonylcarbamoyladenosine biosynthesis protein TsaB|nr:tRNA (adenosine(37)-N6)-threonylcarbamoyltransferase complex dimerization subunit type 1 TsaB [Oscillospiraceae bacterium]HBG55756.1 tRNA (adenosine(37)-N6)-threonylcarbamoyltransferase complex dimerization subunit type 1 TsaB [Oscillospiraceae bacterium]HBQ45502.1 tRNA (adenosine(37)-N6)-threonylcarbamoyltransferase complex dimerization subunit type 1 TsaB [Oscillospiraceae bacterium]HBT90928.1 tRNA (adenosine(37)-N6)-threonylcarbamoyltransferase complex dimerization subunit type 1 TsaB [Osc